ncbi:malto-oligosyltrehalose synthase [Microbacterium sediminicola]|uniref:Malto-oligosyltrehalose synthase n=1 Tax=Microbacterium sediminicola TaxID=415210 RepID=A0ABN2IKW9_9MICO
MRPTSTYRLQIRASFDLDAAADVTGYLRDLGVGWVYLSPLLQATEGSDHGYDVVDPTRVDSSRGGAEGLARFAAAARAAGLGILIDTVPNHMGISRPEQNPWWWDVLRLGEASPHAPAFDIDWDAGGGRVRLPVLGAELGAEIGAGAVTIDPAPQPGAPDGVVRYYDQTFPLAPGTVPAPVPDDAAGVAAVLSAQHYELMFWKRESRHLNYRRFFTISGLAGVRVEDAPVFDASHVEVLRWFREGLADGLRIDHPDGLADPGGYLQQLDTALRDAGAGAPYVVVEKILEHSATSRPEVLPAWWDTEGTTGYDAMAEIDRVLIDPAGESGLTAIDADLREESGLPPHPGWAELSHGTKRVVADTIQVSEINRLVRCLPRPIPDAADALAEILACYPVYRSYLPAGVEWLDAAVADAAARRPDLAASIAALAPLLADPAHEVSRRFQQTAGPVMAKGVEDTGFYRQTRLGTLTEVGGDPSVFAVDLAGFHDALARRQAAWPAAMTALSTHDTKRSEDVRAWLSVLAEMPERWAEALTQLRRHGSTGNGPFDNLLWQGVIGAWPARPDRLHAYAEKAARESAEQTTWESPDPGFEARVHALVDAAFGPARPLVEEIVTEIRRPGWSNALAAKLLQLAGPGVPDVYQGSELWDHSLVDPDNRRSVDFGIRRDLLTRLDEGWRPPVDDTGAAKLLVVSRTLRLRRHRPDLFRRYTPMTVAGGAAPHAIAFDRGGVVAVATRLPVGLDQRGGWGETVLLRHAGPAIDLLTGRRFESSEVRVADLLESYPVALLGPEDALPAVAGEESL